MLVKTITSMSINSDGDHWRYGEGAVHIDMTDEGRGLYFRISDSLQESNVLVSIDELRELLEAAEEMFAQIPEQRSLP